MKRILLRHQQAERDIEDLTDYLAQRNLDAACRLANAIEEALVDLQDLSAVGRARDEIHPKFTTLRSVAVPGFRNYLIFYQITDDVVEIVRVIHGARDLNKIFGD